MNNHLTAERRNAAGKRWRAATLAVALRRSAVALCLALVVTSSSAATITVFAAASLADALKTIGAAYETNAQDKVRFNFGGSRLLARQIEAGAPADLFFSADEASMDALAKKNLIVPSSRQSRLSNRMVIVTASDSTLRMGGARDLASPACQRVALADPSTAPAGAYARQYLEKLGLWSAISPKVVPTENVRAALAAVESGNVEAGIVYKTDAAVSKRVKVAVEIPANETPGISYPVAVVTESKQREGAERFLKFLNSPDAAAVFARCGFLVR